MRKTADSQTNGGTERFTFRYRTRTRIHLIIVTALLLLLVPVVAIAAALYTYIQWALKDEDERDQRPYGKSLKKIILGAVIAESITIIFKIFGL